MRQTLVVSPVRFVRQKCSGTPCGCQANSYAHRGYRMLREDYDLTREDIQLLSNRDALTAFFAKLGYDTNARLVQNSAAMGFSSDNLRPAITHIERLASQDARMFEVYLFELKAVTVTITQAIVRGFRNRPGDYLLVLTLLAEEMIRLNKEKREAQKEFLDWLVTTLKILPDRDGRKGIEVLTGKSKIADYPGDYQKGESPLAFEELHDILLKNKGRLGVSLSDAGLVERVRKEYEGSLERVLPLKERLDKTDALIDQVVYRLYGLTEEEIGAVEGGK